jgi:hypothetical protein
MGKKKSKRKGKDSYPAFKTVAEFQALTQEEKDRAWEYYDREIPMSESRPPTVAEQAHLNRALGRLAGPKRSAGRPKVGQGAKVVAVTLERGFLGNVDAYAKEHGLKRAEMITRGLRLVMGMAG